MITLPLQSTTAVPFLRPRFYLHHLNPLISSSIFSHLPQNPTLKPCLKPSRFSSLSEPLSPPPMAPSILAEYAKSRRSICKTCSNTIASNSLRLGVVTKDKKRGFNMTKWHHLDCFSFDSVSLASPEAIGGFDLLKSDDQEALKKLVAQCDKVEDNEDEAARGAQKSTKKEKVEDDDQGSGDAQKSTKKRKVEDDDDDEGSGDAQKSTKKQTVIIILRDRDIDISAGEKQKSPNKRRLLASEDAKVKIALAMSDIKDKYKEAFLLPKWKAFHTIIFLEKDDGLQDSSKIAAFDFDGCLAQTSVKRIGADAWSLMYPSIPDKLQKLYNDGFKLVIFTNESNIDRWKNKRQLAVDSKIGRLNNFIMHVKVPFQVFVACGFNKYGSIDPYRKPKPGMWHVMEKHFNSGIPVDMDQSFYVGDAAGRESDHSDADIKFAQAVGLKFYVPEDFFVG